MTAFRPLVACSSCGTRWPDNVLDNFGRCPICGLDACPGGHEAHEAHLDINDECPWCGVHR